MTQHTPGPWSDSWIIRGQTPIIGRRENGEAIPGIAPVVAHIIGRDDEASANARLIAAAPDLLAALNDLYDAIPERIKRDTTKMATACAKAYVATRKAEGN